MYYDKLCDLDIKLTRRSGSEKTKCPKCSDGRKNKNDKPLSVNITTGEWNCHNCFSGDTEVITSLGVFTMDELIGGPVFVIDGNGQWVKTEFKNYGKDNLFKIIITRNGEQKSIFATANHRWFARGKVKELTTENLRPGHRLKAVFPIRNNDYELVREGVQHGFVFGDGCYENKKRNTRAYFCGEKDLEMMQYFPEDLPVYKYTERVAIGHLPECYKSYPYLDDNNEYLFSWIAGLFAADGDVAENGLPMLNSAKKEHLQFVRDVCNRIGIGTYTIKRYWREGYGGESYIYRLPFIASTMQTNFFLLNKHKERFLRFGKKYERKRWVVVSVEKTERVEDVFCCEVETTNSFVLQDNILTGNCGFKGNVRAHERKRENKHYEKPPPDVIKNIQIKEQVVGWFDGRGISKATLDKFMIFAKQEWMPQTQKEESCIGFPYMRDGELINIKYRDGRKNFKMVKDAELIFYNLQTIGEKKFCIITEGEIDCMSVYEAGFGVDQEIEEETAELKNEPFSKWAVVSVPNGASKGNQKLEYLDNCSDWFMGLHEIIIATDNDEAGKMLQEELIRRLGVERCKTINYPMEEVVPTQSGLKRRCKDFNEVLMYLGKEVLTNIINNAESIPVDGVYYLEDIFPSMLENFKKGIQLAPTTRFTEMDEYFRWKKGDINLFVGYGNHGKTFFALQLMLTKSIWDGWKWAIFSPENYPANDFYDDLIEMYVGKWLDKMSEEEYTEACHFVSEHIFYVYPDDAHDIHSINERFRHLVLKKGIDGVMVDPFNQLDSTQKAYQRDDQYLSEILKDVKRFALLNNICYNIVAHPKNPDQKNQDRSLPVVDMYDVSGGAMWGNKVDQILSYYRPNFHVNKNDPHVEVYIQKLKRKRTGGKLGSFPLILLWAVKRYANPETNETPCDPKRRDREDRLAQNDYTQPNLYFPYKDSGDDEEAPF
jgi:twinkle protein